MTKRLFLLACLLPISVPAFAQNACPARDIIVTEGDPVAKPAIAQLATTVALRDRTGGAISGADKVPVAATWTSSQITTFQNFAGDSNIVQMVWSQDGTQCFQFVSLPARAPAIGGTPAPIPQGTTAVGANSGRRGTPAYSERDCGRAGSEWLQQIQKDRPEVDIRRVTVVVFRGESGACFLNNERPTQGDPIYIGVFTPEPEVWNGTADFQPCSMEPSAPSVLVTDRLTVSAITQAREWYLLDYLARRCWNSSVSVTVTGTGRRINYTLAQATRYRATLHLGTVFTENHDVTFGLRPESATVNRVYSQGPVEKGPEYVGELVFYSILRYLPPLAGGPAYPGRDPVRDNSFADKLGAAIGIGLQHPSERFNFGFAFEVVAGVNVLGVWDYAQTNVLAGIEEGDVFVGQVDQIPTTKEWRRKFVFGISLDLVYVTAALKR